MSEIVTVTITDFLLARIAEDETRAMPAWRNGELAPDRITRECEAKRRIVELHRIAMWTRHVRVIGNPAGYEDRRAESHCVTCDPDGNEQDGPCLTLRALASVYADHADFDPSWA